MQRIVLKSRATGLIRECSRFIGSCMGILKQRPILLLTVVALKIVLMSITPLSAEFVAFTRLATANDLTYTLSSGSFMFWSLILRPIYGLWLILPVDHPSVWNSIGFWYYNSSNSVTLLVFLLKIPLLVADILTAPVIYKILTKLKVSKNRARFGMTLWLSNPFTTLMAEMGGAPDIVAILLLTVSLYALISKRFAISAVILILSSLVRMYSLFLIPIYFIILREELGNKRSRLFILRYYAFPVALVISVPILLASEATVGGLFPGASGYWFLLGPLAFPIYLAPDLLTALTLGFALLLIAVMSIGIWKTSSRNTVDCLFIFLLSLFAFSYWNPNFLLWLIPFVILDYIVSKRGRIYVISFMAVTLSFMVLSYCDYFASAGNSVFFVPNIGETMTYVSTTLFSLQSTIWISSLSIATILRSAFTGICLAYVFRLAGRNMSYFTKSRDKQRASAERRRSPN